MTIIVAIIPAKIRYNGCFFFFCEDPSSVLEKLGTAVKQNNM
jgi:hypothetical protein